MISAHAATGMAFLALTAALIPGPNMMYLVSRSISYGRSAGLISLAGTLVGFVPYLVMANLGLAAVFSQIPALYAGFKVAGAAYLLYLCVKTLRGSDQIRLHDRAIAGHPRWTFFRMGLLTNALNPKTALIYLALIPQFIVSGDDVVGQGFILGGVQIGVSFAVNALTVLLASSVSASLGSNLHWMAWQRWVTGVLLGVASLMLTLDTIGSRV